MGQVIYANHWMPVAKTATSRAERWSAPARVAVILGLAAACWAPLIGAAVLTVSALG